MADFGPLGGVKITGFISPTDTNDDYAVIDPLYGIDGLRNVGGVGDLDKIPYARRRAGMLVGIDEGDKYYKLRAKDPNLPPPGWDGTINDWEEISFSNNTFSGLTDTTVSSPSDGDYLMYYGGKVINLTQVVMSFTASTSTVPEIIINIPPIFPMSIDKTMLFINGVKQIYGVDYNIGFDNSIGYDVTWLSSKHEIDSEDKIEFIYI